jgi:hypothetical protein
MKREVAPRVMFLACGHLERLLTKILSSPTWRVSSVSLRRCTYPYHRTWVLWSCFIRELTKCWLDFKKSCIQSWKEVEETFDAEDDETSTLTGIWFLEMSL